jgi:alpha-beta hydrolase superfamily lysophospholipase
VRKVIPGSKHEIYRSPDAVLFPWWKEILDFLDGRA